ncbi:MAG: hypothetical protein HY757_07290 [Nitrospirae bacterium]|nr:hypothetical protein [Nitrospirota bacterium]
MNGKNLFIVSVLFLLVSCSSTNTLRVENNMSKFSSSKKIYIETGKEIVPLSSTLENELKIAKFLTTRSRKEADYILLFDYTARFDVKPWVIRSLYLIITAADSGDVLYKVTIDDIKPEPVHSLIERIVDDMTSTHSVKDIALIIKARE